MKRIIRVMVCMLILSIVCSCFTACDSGEIVVYTSEELHDGLLRVDLVNITTIPAPYSRTVEVIRTLDESEVDYVISAISNIEFDANKFAHGPTDDNGVGFLFCYSTYEILFVRYRIGLRYYTEDTSEYKYKRYWSYGKREERSWYDTEDNEKFNQLLSEFGAIIE